MGVDPTWVFDMPAEDWPIVSAAFDRAGELRQRYDKGMADYQAGVTANRTVAGVTRFLRSLAYAWGKRQG